MSTHRKNRAVLKLPKQTMQFALQLCHKIASVFISRLLRGLFWVGFQRRQPTATLQGFVLPTTILLLVVVSLAVGSIGLRTLSRTQQTIGQRQQQIIYNAATPAIDRARAKLEYLFTQDPRLPNGVPGEDDLLAMMLNDGLEHNGVTYTAHKPLDSAGNEVEDPYSFPDEERFNLDENGPDDNAWYFDVELPEEDGVAKTARIIYSILFDTPDPTDTTLSLNDTRTDEGVQARANELMVRNGPLSLANFGSVCLTQQTDPEGGWFSGTVDKSSLRKNFQVSAVVIPGTGTGDAFVKDNTGTIATLELQQDRNIDKGNKWGAWFDSDLEIFPGESFPWNGAIYTNGNLIVGRGKFKAYLISSTASCLNTSRDDSEIVVGESGEVIVGRFDSESTDGVNARFDVFKDGNVEENKRLNQTTDSVTPGGNLSDELGQALGIDPAILMIRSEIVRRDEAAADNLGGGDWDPGNGLDERITRLRNNAQQTGDETPQLSLDDVYRADDRAGPSSSYRFAEQTVTLADLGKSLGDSLNTGLNADQEEALTKLEDANSPEDVGVDGYWERRARNQGMRLIVGQRLELGNAMGWGGLDPDGNFKSLTNQDPTGNPDNFYLDDSYDDPGEGIYNSGFYDDPLMPWDTCHPDTSPNNGTANPSTNNDDRCHEARQRRSLRDNLAAVQATAIYHANSSVTPNVSDGDRPLACLVSTVHPGTAETLRRSATFEDLTAGAMLATSAMTNATDGYPLIISNFFAGRGTNGWEFEPPSAIVNTDMRQALWNLAHYAGDPMGGAPSFPVTQGQEDIVHPYPYTSMWGDFSLLRRILEAEGFAPSSPADKTTLHTAECLLGMLAYNVDYLDKFDITEINTTTTGIDAGTIRNALDTIDEALKNNDIAITPVEYDTNSLTDAAVNVIRDTVKAIQDLATPGAYSGNNPPEMYITALENWINEDDSAFASELQARQILALARLYMQQKQVERDRLYGFEVNNTVALTCTIARLCTDHPKYPILYSLFPEDLNGDTVVDVNDQHGERDADELRTRGFDPTDDGRPGTTDLTSTDFNDNDEALYKGVTVANVAIRPRALSAWTLPRDEGGFRGFEPGDSGPPISQENPQIACVGQACGSGDITQGKVIDVGIKDAAFMDGRQMLNTRALDLDLKMLRENQVPGTGDYWLPLSGIVYGFREDTIREDMIVRPATANVTCETAAELATDNCLMKAAQLGVGDSDRNALESTDPAISDARNVTPKPVDFAPDPERRTHGFRLREGETVKRSGDNGKGLSFISDAPVYIMGDFNWHRPAGTRIQRPDQQIQEFTTTLTYDADDFYGNFYDRTEVDTRFASSTEDDWRPVEIISDAITILSSNFCDGSVNDVFDWLADQSLDNAGVYACEGDERTSYLNWSLPNQTQAKDETWVRENPFDPESPVIFTRNGNPLIKDGTTYQDYEDAYYALTTSRVASELLIQAEDTTVNASLISRIVPSRQFQSYGGFHNFPRLLEDWNNGGDAAALNISGAFFQLDFGRSATAPYDQLQWEPITAVAGESNPSAIHRYYTPAVRRWGYDVALRYAPAAPVSSRFVTVSAARDEFYSEPPAEDPYISKLCEAVLNLTDCRLEE